MKTKSITIDDVLKIFLDRGLNAKVYQVGNITIDYDITQDKFYITTYLGTKEISFEEIVNFFKQEYKRHEKFYTEDYKKSCPFRN